MVRMLRLVGEYTMLMLKVCTKPDKGRIFYKQIISEVDKLGVKSVPIVIIISTFIGAVVTLQMAFNLENPIMPKLYIGLAARDTMLLEFSSTIIALILAGKVGSSITSEIGSMRITEQIDAMEMMGVNSANYLILPKIIAAVVFNPFLTVMSAAVGILGGGIIVALTGIITPAEYTLGIQTAFTPYYLTYSMIKMAVFSFIITSVPAFFGYRASGGSLDVGRASTQAIVASSVLILIFNLILTQLLL